MIHEWVLTGFLALVFFGSGATKLAGQKRHVENFARWRYPPWLRIAGGAVEVAAAALLLPPNLVLYGAGLIAGVMIMAMYTHIARENIPRNAIGPGVLLVLAGATGWFRGPLAIGPAGDLFRILFGG